ncbi:hypothetical protein H7U19_13365 [Hyunsoonleella sp. SJ7]|uniref:DUF4468 domain-containing protein n=1 Tax=Hyunsoonleella aquatilis TaxID=2762758 RepID=A0A923HCJ9_9FLAO|nr:hypothetical protein [Hyunsoonleella aquatilis]MBC3759402.1 hypothetical protein [Hyunsoonleella aquatilis]
MFKHIYLLLLFFVSTISAQIIEVTPKGLVFTEDANAPYIVIQEKGTVQELNNKVLSYLNGIYKNPKLVITTSDNQIVVNAVANKLFKDPAVNVNYNLKIDFKENKIRINIPLLDMTHPLNGGGTRRLHLSLPKRQLFTDQYGIWEKDKLRFPKAKSGIEEYFNSYFLNLINAINAEDDW